MSYTVLARRYRSATFDEVVGQAHVAQTLKKAIESGRIAHAYLFCGTRGTGKTSMARILAKSLNCEKSPGPTAEPCGQCESCKAVARGDDLDVIEIDAASNTGVDNIREVIENSQYRPARSRFKVYIIDEVHMLSKSAFNALLKTLEEPPSHVKFILATTEPEKVLQTILSRCQRYDFRNIPTREIAGHLKNICQKEQIEADEDALLLVAKAGAGSMRDSLSLLDRLLSIGEKKLNIDMIEQLLGMPKSLLIYDLAQAIGEGDVKKVLTGAQEMVQGGLSVDTLLVSLVDHLRNLLILRTCGPESKLVEVPGLSMNQLLKQAEQYDAVVLTQDITILEELRRQIRQSQAGRALLDATLARLAMAEQFATVGELLARVNGGGGSGAPVQKKKFEPASRPVAQPVSAPVQSEPTPVPVADEDDDLPRPGKVWEADKGPSLSELLKQATGGTEKKDLPPATSNIEPVDPANLPDIWSKVLKLAEDYGPGLPAVLKQGRLGSVDEEWAVIRFGVQAATMPKMLERNGKKDQIREALSKALNRNVGVKFDIDATDPPKPAEPAPATPAQQAQPRPRAAEPSPSPAPAAPSGIPLTSDLRKSLESDPLIKSVLDTLGGNIVKVE